MHYFTNFVYGQTEEISWRICPTLEQLVSAFFGVKSHIVSSLTTVGQQQRIPENNGCGKSEAADRKRYHVW